MEIDFYLVHNISFAALRQFSEQKLPHFMCVNVFFGRESALRLKCKYVCVCVMFVQPEKAAITKRFDCIRGTWKFCALFLFLPCTPAVCIPACFPLAFITFLCWHSLATGYHWQMFHTSVRLCCIDCDFIATDRIQYGHTKSSGKLFGKRSHASQKNTFPIAVRKHSQFIWAKVLPQFGQNEFARFCSMPFSVGRFCLCALAGLRWNEGSHSCTSHPLFGPTKHVVGGGDFRVSIKMRKSLWWWSSLTIVYG